LLRLDRLRDTMWAEPIEAILAPLPDHRTIVGDARGGIFERFDTLLMSSPRPSDVTATLVAGRIRGDADAARAFVDRPGAATWKPTRHGLRGARPRDALPHPADTREFLLFDGPRIALAPAAYYDDPSWIPALAAIEAATGDETGPSALVTAAGFPAEIPLPTVGVLPGPQRVTVALVNPGRGFYVVGSLAFADEDQAAQFVAVVAAAKDSALMSFAGKRLLEGIGAFNAASGLAMEQRGATVAFATSVSILDARSLFAAAAGWTTAFYAGRARPE
jgi:hypothetical protein